MSARLLAFTLPGFLALASCGGSGNSVDADAGPSADATTGSNDGVLPPLTANSGVAYVAHFNSTELRSYRLDLAVPEAGEVAELGAPVHDLAIDGENDRLFVVSDVGRWARVFEIERPAAAGAPIAAPTLVAEISFAEIPRFVVVNPYRRRLYVVTADPNQSPLRTMTLAGYDVSDAANPVALDGWPVAIPVTVSFALDPVRDVLFLVELTTDVLHGFDLGGDRFEPLGGEPIALTALYPQENQASFQARNLVADVRRNRLYAARSQTALSELVAFSYPADIPTGGARYRDFASMDELVMIADGFDADLALPERPNLLDAYSPAIDLESGAVFMSGDAWNGTASMAVITAFRPDASLAPSCSDVPDEGFGCFLRSYVAGTAGSYLRTDGALCMDSTRKRVLATSVDQGDETAPGMVHVFDVAADLSLTVALPASNGNLVAGALPIGAVCH